LFGQLINQSVSDIC